MKTLKKNLLLILIATLGFTFSCSDNNSNDDISQEEENITYDELSDADRDALLFMLEEEKLARDTYIYLNNTWSIMQFANIKNSEQSHMNAVATLLDIYDVDYTILPEGEFYDADLQAFYDQFVIDGSISSANALQIGATIEDLDIVDLQDYIDDTENDALLNVFDGLQCGSRNHLRSFTNAITNNGDTYTPQFLTQEEYDDILNGTHEQCN